MAQTSGPAVPVGVRRRGRDAAVGVGDHAQHLAEQAVGVLGDLAPVAGAAAVAGADPEGAVRPEDEVAAVVVRERLADLEVEHAVAGAATGRPSAPSGHERMSVSPPASV